MSRRGNGRSSSAPPSRVDRSRSFQDNDGEEFPTVANEYDRVIDGPAWLQELSSLRSGRHSRASSIISTRTKFSTTTLDEVRSIEFTAGNQSFRISGYGSRITDTTAPPPYSGHLWNDEDHDATSHRHDDEIVRTDPEDSREHDVHDQADHEQQQDEMQNRGRGKRVRIVMPNEDDDDDDEGNRDGNVESPGSAQRVLTKADLYQLMWDLPFQLKRVLGLRPAIQPQSSILRAADNDDDSEQQRSGRARPTSSQSLPDSFHLGSFGGDETDATRPFETERDLRSEPSNSKSSADTVRPMNEQPDLSYPLTVTDLNELSQLYNRVIKDLDREHRKQLHERDKEMAQLRSLLNEKDIVYRQQLRGKDFIIDDLKKQLDHNEDTLETRLEQARNEVEDLWEKRWKERDKHLMDRMRKMEEAGKARSPVEKSEDKVIEVADS